MPWSRPGAGFWQQAPLLRPLVFLTAGILICDQGWISSRHLTVALLLLGLSGVVLGILAFYRAHRQWTESLFAAVTVFFFTAAGYTLYAFSEAGIAEEKIGQGPALSLVRLKAEPQPRARTTRLLVSRLATIRQGKARRASGDALLYLYPDPVAPAFAEGDTLLLPAGWQPIRNSGNPFELDNATLQRRRGIRVQQFLPAGQVVVFGRATPGANGWLRRTQQWCRHRLCDHIADSAALGLLQAMLLGDESSFDPELRQAYAQTGVIHIVSISGSHVAVLYLLVATLLFWAKGRRGSWLKSLVGISLVWFYVLVAGGPPSALRAAFMFTVLALSALGNRESSPLNTLAAAAFILLLYQPAWLFSVGFQLSFGAVLGMMLFYAPIVRLWHWPRKFWLTHKLWQVMAASFSAELLTAPLVIYYFHNFPLLFLPANILAMLLAGFCALSGGLAVIALSWLPAAAQVAGDCVSALIRFFNAGVMWMQGLNIEALQHLRITLPELIVIYALLAALGAWWLQGWRKGPLLALAFGCVLLASLNLRHFAALQQERLIVFNAGREAAVEIIRGMQHHTLAGAAGSYTAEAAHNGYGAWQGANTAAGPCTVVGGRSILFLRDSLPAPCDTCFPVDIVVVERPAWRLKPEAVLRAFSPRQIVLAGRTSQKSRAYWRQYCYARQVPLIEPAEQGAWVLE